MDPNLPIPEFRTMEALVDRAVFARRFVVLLVAGFAAFGLLIASLGIYAVISYSVAQRTREIGIRLALGARPRNIFTQVVAQGMLLALIGVAVGAIGAFGLTRLIASLLFEVTADDPVTFFLTAILLTAVALLACWTPARRAMKTDPLLAIRQ